MPDNAIHEALDALNDVRWRETAFADLQWYYAEGGVYVLRCKKGDPNEHLCVIRAKSADEAIARVVFNFHKAGESMSASECNAAAMLFALSLVKKLFDGRLMFQSDIREAHKAVCAALSKPPRQCDIGTAEEQVARFKTEMCDTMPQCRPWDECCLKCLAKWEQKTYKAKGEEGNGSK